VEAANRIGLGAAYRIAAGAAYRIAGRGWANRPPGGSGASNRRIQGQRQPRRHSRDARALRRGALYLDNA